MIDAKKFLKKPDGPRGISFVVYAHELGKKFTCDVLVDCRIEAWLMLAYCGPERNGSAQITVSKRPKDSAEFVNIVGSTPPKLSNTDMAVDDQLAEWTTDISAGDTLAFTLDSVSDDVVWVTLRLAFNPKPSESSSELSAPMQVRSDAAVENRAVPRMPARVQLPGPTV